MRTVLPVYVNSCTPGLAEQIITPGAPDRRDATNYEYPATPQTVRLVRHVASTGKVGVLMANLLDSTRFPASRFGGIYHQRWRIEEAFKRLKRRLNMEPVSGLSQLAVIQYLAAKVLCDNLQALATLTAHACHALPPNRRINRACVHIVLKPLLPSLFGLAWGVGQSCCSTHWHSWHAIPTDIGTECRNHANLVQNRINS